MFKRIFRVITTLPLVTTTLIFMYSYIFRGGLSFEESEILQITFAFSLGIFCVGSIFSNQRMKEFFDKCFDEMDEEDEWDDEIDKEESFSIASIVSVVVVLLFSVAAVVFLWKTTSYNQKNDDYKNPQINKVAVETIDNELSEKTNVEYTDEGCFLHSLDGNVAGPFQYIFESDFDFYLDNIARYIGNNGLYGYVNRNGKILTEPVFIGATKFQDGTAKVQTNKETVFYIDETGVQFTKEYTDGEIFEMQGQYCRVKTADGKWGIIDREDNLIFSGCDSIQKLPLVTTFGSAVINGHAVLFELNSMDGKEFRVIKEYEEFTKISEVHLGAFALVWNEENQVGVVNSLGNIIVEPIYDSVDYKIIKYRHDGTDFTLDNILFLATDQEGFCHVIKTK